MNNTVSLKTSRIFPAEARGWPLRAARDFSSAVSFLRKEAACRGRPVEHLALLLGAVIAYARPFTDGASRIPRRYPDQHHCLLEIAADLGVDRALHASVLLARQELIAVSAPPQVWHQRASGSRRQVRSFAYPNPRCSSITGRIDLREFERAASLMRLACVFLLAELMPASHF